MTVTGRYKKMKLQSFWFSFVVGQEILSLGNVIILFVLAMRFYYCVVVFVDEIKTDLG